MLFFTSIHAQLGLMTWPLTVLSLLTLVIISERIVFLTLHSRSRRKDFIKQLYQQKSPSEFSALSSQLLMKKSTFEQGAGMLLRHAHFEKSLREETVNIWLQKKRRTYLAGIRLLTIIGIISPLIGLLGTVLGLIDMFKDLATTQGSIEPALLADGLGLAMSTTAAGLLIALPAITSAQLFTLWVDNILANIEHALNHCNLYLEGVGLEGESHDPIAI
ncbi:biopolymer transporter ExbB [Vibrio sp. 10N.286.49.B3]|uniref:MotA/TolQ/ExbB proton channel family protein n=1 Tax=Vibrio sp. 10N.286.49.B3 TaxID=1880855 RepID=UPI000C842520|nr:MotA/TolQ/ExbB proton channel family protein [Vibrio sp. 10N.286.49.B3]PMH37102.1 biopolymer transporter ExbB [Vibrio sp. 10N.286.49.B3]